MDEQQQETKRCPMCGEEILAVAIKCRHCQSSLGGAQASEHPRVRFFAGRVDNFPLRLLRAAAGAVVAGAVLVVLGLLTLALAKGYASVAWEQAGLSGELGRDFAEKTAGQLDAHWAIRWVQAAIAASVMFLYPPVVAALGLSRDARGFAKGLAAAVGLAAVAHVLVGTQLLSVHVGLLCVVGYLASATPNRWRWAPAVLGGLLLAAVWGQAAQAHLLDGAAEGRWTSSAQTRYEVAAFMTMSLLVFSASVAGLAYLMERAQRE